MSLGENLSRVRDDIARIQAREGLDGDVRIVAVTKGHPPETVREAWAAGLTDIGENRVQEAVKKQEETADVPAAWHLVGHLQTNKARQVAGRFALVHSVDSFRVAEALANAVKLRSAGPLSVLLQINLSREAQKSGCDPAEAVELACRLAALPDLELKGLMTMAPYTDDEPAQRRVFRELRAHRDRMQQEGLRLPELSMGMSGDYRAAVAEGATMLRLGTVLFGERPG